MKKAFFCLLIVLALVVLSEPHVRGYVTDAVRNVLDSRQEAAEQSKAPSFYDQLGSHERSDLLGVTLYFRFFLFCLVLFCLNQTTTSFKIFTRSNYSVPMFQCSIFSAVSHSVNIPNALLIARIARESP